MATSADGTRIAWYRYGGGDRAILFVPTWNLVDARVVGHQVAALESRATIVTYDPRGAGASERPKSGYDFPLHAADALAVLETTGIEQVALVTASRGVNAAVLLATDDPERFDRVAVIAPYMQLEAEPAPPNPEWLEALRTDWPGFIVPFMHSVFTEPDSADVIAEMIAIGLEATPEVVVTQELELDWQRPAHLLGRSPARRSSSTAKPTRRSRLRSPRASWPRCRTHGSSGSPPVGIGPTSAPRSSSTRSCWISLRPVAPSPRPSLQGTFLNARYSRLPIFLI